MRAPRLKDLVGAAALLASALAGAALAVAVERGVASTPTPARSPRGSSRHGAESPDRADATQRARGERAGGGGELRVDRERSGRSSQSDPLLGASPAAVPHDVRWIAAGGGPTPEYNQLSVEDDLALFADTLGADRGLLLFAGGPGTRSVQVLDTGPRGDDLARGVGDFFDARDGRDAHYRATRLALNGPATISATLGAIETALHSGEGPLTVFLAGHGTAGEAPGDAELLMWGDESLTPAVLAATLDHAPADRTVRVIITSCYSGGFGEIAYRGARPDLGLAEADRCGFFAAPWDLEAAGCDPDPNRAVHEGYAVYFLAALRGQDRRGHDALALLDLDHDGHVSLLEAHVRAVIASTSLDVPTTTSETWLRAAAPEHGAAKPFASLETDAVVSAMALRTGLVGREARARIELARMHETMAQLAGDLGAIDEDEARAYRAASAALLSRWPVLDDPWHPDFDATLASEHDAVSAFFDGAPEMLAWRDARARIDALEQRLDDARVDAAPYERLVRALDDRALSARLHAQGGTAWHRYERLLACERGTL